MLFPPYFRDLELGVLEDIFLPCGSRKEREAAAKDTTKEEDEAKAIVAKEETSEKSTTTEGAKKKQVSKRKKAVKQKTSKKKKWSLDVDKSIQYWLFQSDAITFYEQNTFKLRCFEKYPRAKKSEVSGKWRKTCFHDW